MWVHTCLHMGTPSPSLLSSKVLTVVWQYCLFQPKIHLTSTQHLMCISILKLIANTAAKLMLYWGRLKWPRSWENKWFWSLWDTAWGHFPQRNIKSFHLRATSTTLCFLLQCMGFIFKSSTWSSILRNHSHWNCYWHWIIEVLTDWRH